MILPRYITTHKVNQCNDAIDIHANDEPGNSGANSEYMILLREGTLANYVARPDGKSLLLAFQNGPILEGINGITHEVLLAIVIDRLQAFQKGPFVCRENAIALTKLEEAVHWLKHRTERRAILGIEGTHTV